MTFPFILNLYFPRYQWGATPLEDNLPTDSYHYQISVYTGMKKGAGTKSNISFIISGEERDTGVRRIFDGKRKARYKYDIHLYVIKGFLLTNNLTILTIE